MPRGTRTGLGMRHLAVAVVSLALFEPAGASLARGSPAAAPAKGKLLVAARQLQGGGFEESVILLVEHGPRGSLGLIVNRPSSIKLADVLPSREGARERDDDLWVGGPVQPTRVMLLVRASEPLPDGLPVFDQVQLVTGLRGLDRAFEMELPAGALRAYAGHAGWAPGQLAGEIARGDWLVVDAEVRAVFSSEPTRIWAELIEEGPGRWVRGNGPAAQAAT